MLKEFEKLSKENCGILTPDTNKEHASFIRRLLWRSIDVSENFEVTTMFPSLYRNMYDAKYLLWKACEEEGEGFHAYSLEVEYIKETGEKICKVFCPSFDSCGDYDGHIMCIAVHSEILTDYWKKFLEGCRVIKKIEYIKKQISDIEKQLSTGPSQIEALKKELEKYESLSNMTMN